MKTIATAFSAILLLVLSCAPASAATPRPIKAVGGPEHSLVLMDDGQVLACGMNSYGQLGLTGTQSRNRPSLVTKAASDIACGYSHSLILLKNGAVLASGYNSSGQLGTGNNSSAVLRQVLVGVRAIAASDSFSLFLMNDGSVRGCGRNIYGQLGLNDAVDRNSPTVIPGLSGIKAIACGKDYSLFLANDGSVLGTGSNASGELGLGDDLHRYVPTIIPGLPAIAKISAGIAHSIFLSTVNEAWGCGYNVDGQLFEESTTSILTSKRIFPIGSQITDIAAGAAFSLFVQVRSGVHSVVGRGNNAYSQLGLGGFGAPERKFRTVPVTNPEAVFATYYNGFVRSSTHLKPNGPALLVFGYNSQGQAGVASGDTVTTPQCMLLLSPRIAFKTPKAGSITGNSYSNTFAITNAPYAGRIEFYQIGNGKAKWIRLPKVENSSPRIRLTLVDAAKGSGLSAYNDQVRIYDRSGKLINSVSIKRLSKSPWMVKSSKTKFKQTR